MALTTLYFIVFLCDLNIHDAYTRQFNTFSQSKDLVTADSAEESVRRAKEALQKQNDPLHSKHGLDSHYQRRMQERLERQAVCTTENGNTMHTFILQTIRFNLLLFLYGLGNVRRIDSNT
jgi:hypothetical protein